VLHLGWTYIAGLLFVNLYFYIFIQQRFRGWTLIRPALQKASARCVQLPIDVAESCDKKSIGDNIRQTHSVESNSNAENFILKEYAKIKLI
jgi:hypothetical protein